MAYSYDYRMKSGSAEAAKARRIVKEVLRKHGFRNKFSVRRTGFSDLMRSDAMVATVKDWEPDPIVDDIKEEVREKGKRQGVDIVVMFEGDFIM